MRIGSQRETGCGHAKQRYDVGYVARFRLARLVGMSVRVSTGAGRSPANDLGSSSVSRSVVPNIACGAMRSTSILRIVGSAISVSTAKYRITRLSRATGTAGLNRALFYGTFSSPSSSDAFGMVLSARKLRCRRQPHSCRHQRQRSISSSEWTPPRSVSTPAVPPDSEIHLAVGPAAQWTCAHKGHAFFAYATNRPIDLDHAVVVNSRYRLRRFVHAYGFRQFTSFSWSRCRRLLWRFRHERARG